MSSKVSAEVCQRDPQTAKETYEKDLKGHIQTRCTRETIHTNEQQSICRNVKRDPQTAKETYERELKRDIQTKCTREIQTNEKQGICGGASVCQKRSTNCKRDLRKRPMHRPTKEAYISHKETYKRPKYKKK